MLTQIPRRAFLKEGALETCLLLLSLLLCPAEKQENILLSNLSRLQQGRRRSACLSPVRPGSRNDRNEIVCRFSRWAWGAQGTGRLVSHTAFSPQGLGSARVPLLQAQPGRSEGVLVPIRSTSWLQSHPGPARGHLLSRPPCPGCWAVFPWWHLGQAVQPGRRAKPRPDACLTQQHLVMAR